MNKVGINDEAIRKLCLEINDYSETIENTLNQISDTYREVKPYFKGDLSTEFDSKFSNLEDSFKNIYENVSSYIDDFNNLALRYENFDIELSKKVKKDTENIMKGGIINANNR